MNEKPLIRVQGMGHRRHIRSIDGIHPANEVEDFGEFLGAAGHGLVADLEARQVGNSRDLVAIDCHDSITCEEGWLTAYFT